MALVLYCRAGFEKDCAAEILHHAESLGLPGQVRAQPNAGFVEFTPHGGAAALRRALKFDTLVFARQIVFTLKRVENLPPQDRLSGILAAIPADLIVSACVVEHADTNEAKTLSPFSRKFAPYLERALGERKQLAPDDTRAPRLNVFFMDATSAWVGLTDPANSSPWPMGIARLRMPGAAPSRSTLKLAEAWMCLLTPAERERYLTGGLRAVDLGAAPGGWTWQLVNKGMLVTAIDNGRMDANLMAGGMVEHIRADGFDYRPRRNVDWMVCDMVEKPARVAELAAKWLAEKRTARAIVNFKLPMKKRFEEWLRVQDIILSRTEKAGVRVGLRAKQLYHDREEVTAYLFRRE